jgi:hypothetical protein
MNIVIKKHNDNKNPPSIYGLILVTLSLFDTYAILPVSDHA